MENTLERPAFYRVLTAHDRCDQCIGQAFARAVKVIDGTDHELVFCGHHYARNEPALIMAGWLTQDDRHLINEKPMSGTPADYVPSND